MTTYVTGEPVQAMLPGCGWVPARYIRPTWNLLTGSTGHAVCLWDDNNVTAVATVRPA